ncbi:hypothetical protein CBL_04422 [Carabus blaptoides fortunei]
MNLTPPRHASSSQNGFRLPGNVKFAGGVTFHWRRNLLLISLVLQNCLTSKTGLFMGGNLAFNTSKGCATTVQGLDVAQGRLLGLKPASRRGLVAENYLT